MNSNLELSSFCRNKSNAHQNRYASACQARTVERRYSARPKNANAKLEKPLFSRKNGTSSPCFSSLGRPASLLARFSPPQNSTEEVDGTGQNPYRESLSGSQPARGDGWPEVCSLTCQPAGIRGSFDVSGISAVSGCQNARETSTLCQKKIPAYRPRSPFRCQESRSRYENPLDDPTIPEAHCVVAFSTAAQIYRADTPGDHPIALFPPFNRQKIRWIGQSLRPPHRRDG